MVLSPTEARKLLASIDTGTLTGLRDRVLISVMLSADVQRGPGDASGHDVSAHHGAAAALDAYIEGAELEEPKSALFQSLDPPARRLSGRALERRGVLAMIKRRAAAAGLPPSTCCHTFPGVGDHGVPVERGYP